MTPKTQAERDEEAVNKYIEFSPYYFLISEMKGHAFIEGIKYARTEMENDVKVLVEALVWCDEMLEARDIMNSKVHCAPVRLSAITIRVKEALEKFRSVRDEK